MTATAISQAARRQLCAMGRRSGAAALSSAGVEAFPVRGAAANPSASVTAQRIRRMRSPQSAWTARRHTLRLGRIRELSTPYWQVELR